jgi:hypothetical protein
MTTPKLGAPELVAGQAVPETTVNEQIRYLEQGAQWFGAIIDRNLTAPPGSPSDGDAYIVAAGATGAWADHDGEIAFRFGSSWNFITPTEGMGAYFRDEDAAFTYDGANWDALGTGSGVLVFQGNIDASANPNYPAATKGDAYLVSAAGKVGGASGKDVNVGDLVVASADNAGGNEATVGTSWFVLAASMDGVLLAANNLADVDDVIAARENLELGTAALLDFDDDQELGGIYASDDLIPTQLAVKEYVDSIAGTGGFQGEIDASDTPLYPAATAGQWWAISDSGFIGGFGGKIVHARDIVFCISDSPGGFQADVGNSDFTVFSPDAWRYVGTRDATAEANFPDATTGDLYRITGNGKIGGAAGRDVVDGDIVVCIATTESGNEADVGFAWVTIPGGSAGGIALDDLTDVEIATPAHGDVLQYDEYLELWKNTPLESFNQFMGGIDCSADPNFPAATAGEVYYVSAAGKIGSATGKPVNQGDMLFCIIDTASGTWLDVGESWLVISADALFFAGIIDCAANPNYPLGVKGAIYRALNDGKIGGASGKPVSHGDYIICHASNTSGGDEATVGGFWDVIHLSGAASLALDDLTDVDAPTPSEGQVLTYHESPAGWFPENPASGGYTDENARDAIGAALIGGDGLTKTIDDPGETITLDVDFATALEVWDGTEAAKAIAPDVLRTSRIAQALTYSANITADFDAGKNFKVILTGDTVFENPSNRQTGDEGYILVTQDGSGGHGATFASAWNIIGDDEIDETAGALSLIHYWVVEGSDVYAAIHKGGGSAFTAASSAEMHAGDLNDVVATPLNVKTAAAYVALGNTGSVTMNMDAGINFSTTPSTTITITPSNLKSGWSGTILIDNSGGETVNFGGGVWAFLAGDSTIGTGVYLVSYISDGTNVYAAVGGYS